MNRVKQYRTKKGLSQRKLAELAGTSQQQIQRIETGRIAARLDLAKKLSAALGQPLNKLFPGSEKAVKFVIDGAQAGFIPADSEFNELAKSGVEVDIREWYFKFLLRGHREPFVHKVAGADKRRLFLAVQDENAQDLDLTFLVYDTACERIAINVSELVFCHFLFEPMGNNAGLLEEEMLEVRAFLCGDERRLGFRVEPGDYLTPEDEEMGEFNGIFFDLGLGVDRTDRIHFIDEDGEDVFIRAGDLAMLQVPLWVVEPDDASDEDDDVAEEL